MTSPVLQHTLRQLANFAEIRGATYEAASWRRLAETLEEQGAGWVQDLIQLARDDRLAWSPAVDPAMRIPVAALLLDGPEAVLADALARLPRMLRELLESSVLDSDEAVVLGRAGIVTLTDLSRAFEDGLIARLVPDRAGRLEFARVVPRIDRPRLTLGRAADLIDNLMVMLVAAHPALEDLTPAGGVRRMEAIIDDLVLVAAAPDPATALDAIAGIRELQILHRSDGRVLAGYHQFEVDIRVAAPREFGTVLHTATGSAAHLRAVAAIRPSSGACSREEAVYAQAVLPWIPPELRQGTGEIEAALEGRLPGLVTRADIRGDLHTHTSYSDGRDTVAEMVEMAARLGYEYIAITDHSERAAASRTLTRASLARQRDEIDRLREKFPGLSILHGVEVDIMADGTLDFPDDLLRELDIVLASLHEGLGHDPARLTRRCLAAIAHPLVNVITHPANRLVGRHSGYALDFEAIYAAAAGTGTALEIDGAPNHLDLDGEHARQAVAAGVTVTIDSDCHKAAQLDRQMRFGVGTGRRGWVEPRHVLNTRPLAEVRAFIAAKRART